MSFIVVVVVVVVIEVCWFDNSQLQEIEVILIPNLCITIYSLSDVTRAKVRPNMNRLGLPRTRFAGGLHSRAAFPVEPLSLLDCPIAGAQISRPGPLATL